MNKTVATIIAIVFSVLTFLLSIGFGSYRDSKAIDVAVQIHKKNISVALNQIAESIRQELILGNLRHARNFLEIVKTELLFSDYAIERNNILLESTSNFDIHSQSSDYVKTNIDIYFSKGGVKWGTLIFLTSSGETRMLANSLQETLLFSSAISSITVLILLWFIFAVFWRSSTIIGHVIDQSLNEREPLIGKLSNELWRPAIETIRVVTEKNVNLSKQLNHSKVQVALGDLAERVAHDIRSPLSSLNLVMAKIQVTNPGHLEIIQKAIERINGIANQLLKKDLGSHNSNFELNELSKNVKCTTNLHQILNDIINEKRIQLDSNRIKFDIHCPVGSVVLVHAEYIELSRIISNLLNNSIESFASESGEISLSVEISDEKAVLNIQDNGKGIPKNILAELGSKRITFGKDGVGTGLGILSAKENIQKWNGNLQINSRLNEGTLVQLTFERMNS